MKVVLFHKNCQDGLFAAFSFWKKYGAKDILFIEVNYKPIQDLSPMAALEYIFNSHIRHPSIFNTTAFNFTEVPKNKFSEMELYILDYCVPVEHAKLYATLFKSILILDHHKTAIDQYVKECSLIEDIANPNWKIVNIANNCKVVFSETESGAKLTYRYLNPGQEAPDYIELVSDYDLWKFSIPGSKNFHYGIKLLDPESFIYLEMLLNSYRQDIVNVGQKFKKYENGIIEKISDSNCIGVVVKIKGIDYKGCMINAYPDIRNDLCDMQIKNGYDLAMCYNIKADGNVVFSLRSRKGLDTTPLSLMYNGGGHENASSFTISSAELASIIKKRYITVVKKRNYFDLFTLVKRIFNKILGALS